MMGSFRVSLRSVSDRSRLDGPVMWAPQSAGPAVSGSSPGLAGASVLSAGPVGEHTGSVRIRAVLIVVVLLNIAAASLEAWLLGWPEQATLARALGGPEVRPFVVLPGLAWLGTGVILAWVRPRNAIGWLLVGVGSIQVVSVLISAYGGMGVLAGNPEWPAARWAAWLASALWIAGLLPLISVLPALYPDGQLPGPRWKWPVAAATLGTVLLTFGLLLDPGAYDDIAPGGSPVSVRVPGWVGLTWGELTGASCARAHAHDLGDDGGPVDPYATD